MYALRRAVESDESSAIQLQNMATDNAETLSGESDAARVVREQNNAAFSCCMKITRLDNNNALRTAARRKI